jgi:hypothetical protein
MRRVLKPGGALVVEDADMSSAHSSPESAFDVFSDLFGRLGAARGLDYTLANRLHRMVRRAGFPRASAGFYDPELRSEEDRMLLIWTIEEAAPALLTHGIIEREELVRAMGEMRTAAGVT